jgi:DNA polymerase V
MVNNIIKHRVDNTIADLFYCKISTFLPRPLLGNEVSAGFPSPAQDYIEENLDLNEHLITMVDAGIYPGDILIVDRAVEPAHKKIVIAIVDGELTVKRLYKKSGKWFLAPENPEFEPLEITRDINFHIWGVVIYSIHKMR